jgi:hypothetical protein
MTKAVLILTAEAGLGHRHAAEAIAAALEQRYGRDCADQAIPSPANDDQSARFELIELLDRYQVPWR